ncbi:uroporphyrinogen-III synthase [compost metagenome]
MVALAGMGVADPAAALQGAEIACIGPVTAKTAEEAGLNVSILAEEATIDSLLQALCAWKAQTGSED